MQSAQTVDMQVKKILAEFLGRPMKDLSDDALLQDDLDVDSTEMIEIVCAVERAFQVRLGDGAEKALKTVADIHSAVDRAKRS
ncbi:phosphopantetheine-binding protein [Sorangium sp. So ce363]|uniref:phosphopantetheine-binding protein n=1 Tax=unclassified Sorangium TaxID=2621164 RepID=UPI003F5DE55C